MSRRCVTGMISVSAIVSAVRASRYAMPICGRTRAGNTLNVRWNERDVALSRSPNNALFPLAIAK